MRKEQPWNFQRKNGAAAIAQLLEINPATTNAALAERYGVSTRTITQDRAKLRENEAGEADSPLADLRRAYRRNMERLKQAKTEIKEGTRLYLDHVVTEFKLTMDYLKALQSLGVVPKNVGAKEITRWDFVSPTPGLLNLKKPTRNVGLGDQQGQRCQ